MGGVPFASQLNNSVHASFTHWCTVSWWRCCWAVLIWGNDFQLRRWIINWSDEFQASFYEICGMLLQQDRKHFNMIKTVWCLPNEALVPTYKKLSLSRDKLISWELVSWQVDLMRVDLVAIDLARIDLVTPSWAELSPAEICRLSWNSSPQLKFVASVEIRHHSWNLSSQLKFVASVEILCLS